MRRTSERGWVAKAYPEDRTNSQTDVNLFDDLSDCESLDSFFDDEFDIEEQEEKLGNLLSCNTLGVESRVSIKTNKQFIYNLITSICDNNV